MPIFIKIVIDFRFITPVLKTNTPYSYTDRWDTDNTFWNTTVRNTYTVLSHNVFSPDVYQLL